MGERLNSFIEASDGTRLAVYSQGESSETICLTNGLGGSYSAWRHLVDYFSPKHHLLSWDYRGLYRSGPPASANLAIEQHAQDLIAVLDANKVKSCIHVGWSMGVQVLLELCRLAPERVKALVLIGGAAGHPFESAMGGGPAAKWVRPIIDKLHEWEPMFGGLVPMVAPLTVFLPWLRLTGIIAPTMDSRLVAQVAADFLRIDFDVYLATLKELGEHDATDVLPSIAAPTLVIVGSNDLFTPPEASQVLHNGIKDSEILVVRTGTHYVPVEFPELVNLRINKFLQERVF
jgi:pimeloyl-ACP methyl ester carboxylesterase